MGMSVDQNTYARMLLSDPGSSAVQSLLIVGATGGTFTITFNGQTTTPLAYNAGANVIQNALAALSSIGLGNITVNNGPNNGSSVNNTQPWDLYFGGTLASVAQPMITVDTSGLVGIGITATVGQIALGGVLAFSDADLDLLYAQADLNFYRAIQYGYMALVADFSRLNDYVAGQSQEKRSQIYDHNKEQVLYYQQWANADRQVQPVSLITVPPVVRAVPVTSGVPATSLQYNSRRGPWGWRRGG
jgi:hypothetical protein